MDFPRIAKLLAPSLQREYEGMKESLKYSQESVRIVDRLLKMAREDFSAANTRYFEEREAWDTERAKIVDEIWAILGVQDHVSDLSNTLDALQVNYLDLTNRLNKVYKENAKVVKEREEAFRELAQEQAGRKRFMTLSEKWKGLYWNGPTSSGQLLKLLKGALSRWREMRKRADDLYEALSEIMELFALDNSQYHSDNYANIAQENALEVAKSLLNQRRPIQH